MTDARFPDRWLYDRRIARLSATDYRSWAQALIWSVATRTDGQIEREDLDLIPQFDPSSVFALVKQDLWRPLPDVDGWIIDDFATTQTSRSDLERLERIRKAEREKKADQRARKRVEAEHGPPGLSPGTFGGTQQEGQEGRTGEDGGGEVRWDVAQIPPSDSEGWIEVEPGVWSEVK